MDYDLLKELTKHPGWDEYLTYIEELKLAALQQMEQLNADQIKEFIVLNSRLHLLNQITQHFELDLFDDGSKNQLNLERLQSIQDDYQERRVGLLRRLLESVFGGS